MERNKLSSSKDASPRKTPEASSGGSQSAPSSHESPDHPTQEPKIWTLTNSPRSAPLMAAPTCDLTDNTAISPPPLTTEARPGPSTLSEETTSESSVSQQPSKPNVSLLSTASDESLASDSACSSTVSCKTPVAARNEVVITMDDNDRKIIHPADKSEREVLNVAKDTRKGSNKEEAVITRRLDDEEESSVKSESESSTEEVISKNQEAEMKDTKKGDAIIDIMGSDNNNEEMSAINEKSNDGKSLLLDQHVTYFSLFKFVCLEIIQPSNLNRTTNSAEREGMIFLLGYTISGSIDNDKLAKWSQKLKWMRVFRNCIFVKGHIFTH